MRTLFVLTVVLFFSWVSRSSAGDTLLRFPDVHGNQVIFVAQEDIWMASTEGGTAVRLTMNDGEEQPLRVKAPDLFSYFSNRESGISTIKLSRSLNIGLSSISCSV